MIEVEHLSYTYPKVAGAAIQDLNFTIAPGAIFGLLGPSGAGKSTTQKILIGLLRQYRGRVRVLGQNLSCWRSDYYERIGVSFEFPNHFLKLTGIENLAYFGSLYSRATLEPQTVLAMVGLEQDGTLPVGQYSKGMLNRLSLARALLHNPDLLFLDEPTSGLDPANARRIQDVLKEQQAAGKTIFLTTHAMAVADELCDQVAFMLDGSITLIDAPRNLKLRYGEATVRVEYRTDAGICRQDFALRDLGANPDFLQLLRSGTVQTLHSREATLEDVFLRVTGRSGA